MEILYYPPEQAEQTHCIGEVRPFDGMREFAIVILGNGSVEINGFAQIRSDKAIVFACAVVVAARIAMSISKGRLYEAGVYKADCESCKAYNNVRCMREINIEGRVFQTAHDNSGEK